MSPNATQPTRAKVTELGKAEKGQPPCELGNSSREAHRMETPAPPCTSLAGWLRILPSHLQPSAPGGCGPSRLLQAELRAARGQAMPGDMRSEGQLGNTGIPAESLSRASLCLLFREVSGRLPSVLCRVFSDCAFSLGFQLPCLTLSWLPVPVGPSFHPPGNQMPGKRTSG